MNPGERADMDVLYQQQLLVAAGPGSWAMEGGFHRTIMETWAKEQGENDKKHGPLALLKVKSLS